MVDQIRLRPVTKEERTRFMEMSAAYYRELDTAFVPTPEWESTYFKMVMDDSRMMLMWIVRKTSIVGFVLVGHHHHRFRPWILVGHIYEFYVEPKFRGSSIAATAARLTIERLKELGCTRIQLEVLVDNHRAKRFWSRIGFQKHSERYTLPMERRG